jgi:hypothetical protein
VQRQTLGRRVEKRCRGRGCARAPIAARLGTHFKAGKQIVTLGEFLRRVGPRLKRQSHHDGTNEEQRGQRGYRQGLLAVELDHGWSSAILK